MDLWEQSLPDRGKSKCKCPLEEVYLLCHGMERKLRVAPAGTERAKARMIGDEAEGMEGEGEAVSHRALLMIERTWALTLEQKESHPIAEY